MTSDRQPDLFDRPTFRERLEIERPDFDGATYEAKRDKQRLTGQVLRVFRIMSDGRWRSLTVIEEITGYPQASISARLRDLRKEKFGNYVVERRRICDSALWEYRMRVNLETLSHRDYGNEKDV